MKILLREREWDERNEDESKSELGGDKERKIAQSHRDISWEWKMRGNIEEVTEKDGERERKGEKEGEPRWMDGVNEGRRRRSKTAFYGEKFDKGKNI